MFGKQANITDSNKQITFGTIVSYISIAISILSGLIYTPWMIKCIGQSDYGIFTLANSVITLFVIDFGLSSAVVRFLSVYYSKGERDKADNLLGLVYKLYIIIDAAIFLILIVIFFCIDTIYSKFTPDELTKLKTVYCIVGLYTLINFPFVTLNGILEANERFVEVKTAEILNRVLILVLMIAFLKAGFGLYTVVLVNSGVGILTILFKLVIIKKNGLAKPNFKYNDKNLFKEVFAFSVWITVQLLAERLIYNITPSMLGITLGAAGVAVFGIASAIESYTYTFASAINGFFYPSIARLYTSDENADITPLMTKVGTFQFCLFGLIFAGFFTIGAPFIKLWVGGGYIEAYYILCTILGIELFGSALNIGYAAVRVKNKVRILAVIALIAGVINVIGVFVFSKIFGVIGAGISIAVSRLTNYVLSTIVFKKELHIKISDLLINVYAKSLIPVFIMIAFGKIMQLKYSINSWSSLAVFTLILTMVYAAAAFVVNRRVFSELLHKFR